MPTEYQFFKKTTSPAEYKKSINCMLLLMSFLAFLTSGVTIPYYVKNREALFKDPQTASMLFVLNAFLYFVAVLAYCCNKTNRCNTLKNDTEGAPLLSLPTPS